MNPISPSNHPESPLSGSTVENMISRAQELGNKYFAITDNGYLISTLKAYMACKKKDIKPILGVELYFKDFNCDIVKNTESEKIKYFKIIVHARDQIAYQKLVKICSNFDNKTIDIQENKYPLIGWKELEELSLLNVTVCTSDTQCMVSKHLLVNRADIGLKYYEKLRSLFKDNFYPTILPFSHNKYWNAIVKITYFDKKEIQIPAFDRVEIQGENRVKAIEIVKKLEKGNPCLLTHVYINKIKYPVKPSYQEITKAELLNDFQSIPEGDLQLKANKFIYALAHKYGDADKILINSYSYYAEADDKIVQDMRLGEENRIYQNQHIQSYEEISLYLSNFLNLKTDEIDQFVNNSFKWAEKFDNFDLKYNYRLPSVGQNPEKQVMDIIEKKGRMKWNDSRYVNQFKEEFDLLTKNGVVNLLPYFIPLIDVFDFYEKNGYLTGPARGSAGGFLLSYLMGITHIDPIKYNLSSSRFLTLDRIQQGNLPDIDSDFESREPLVGKNGYSGFLYGKYGNKAAQLSTRTLLRIKSAILDANRFVNKGTLEPDIQKFSKSLPNTPQGISDADFVFGREDESGNHIEGLLETNDDLQKYALERPKEWDIVQKALSLSRQNSRHACSFIIADCDIEDVVPVFEIGGVKRVTQPEHKQCEFAKLIKYDFLVVSAVKDIRMAIDYINSKEGYKLPPGYFYHKGNLTYIWDLPEDPEVFKQLSEGFTETVFQLNTPSVTPAVKKIKPESIIDCATITSLWRPGPLDFIDPTTGRNMAEEYIERRHGRSKADIPILEELLPETYGVLVFQEQVTYIAQKLGKMSVIDSENVRIAMGKKKLKEMEKLKPSFIKGASQTVGTEVAEKIWSMMATFARYGFNKSHAVAYSVISYACAFLKYHYPLEWWASVISNADDKEINEVFYKYIKDMVLPPDINISTEKITIDYTQNKLRNKLSMISGLGKKVAEKIIENRPYNGISDFVEKKVCGPKLIKRLIFVGALDSLFEKESSLIDKMRSYENAVVAIDYKKKIKDYENKLAIEKDEKKIKRMRNHLDKLYSQEIPKGDLDPAFMIGGLEAFLMKKSIFPTINLDLDEVMAKRITGKYETAPRTGGRYLLVGPKEEYRIADGENLQSLDNAFIPSDADYEVTIACAGYVIDLNEFTYKQGTKKALKLIIDCSGYVSEKVLWPDRFLGVLDYPKNLKKGSVAYFIFKKKPAYNNRCDTHIEKILVEHEGLS